MEIKKQLQQVLLDIVSEIGVSDVSVDLAQPELSRGDYTTNIAMILASHRRQGSGGQVKLGQSPMEIAAAISANGKWQMANSKYLEKIEVVKPGFINFWLKTKTLTDSLEVQHLSQVEPLLRDKKYLVEYAHPNTHKEMHIGHMRTLITGEAVSRLLGANGADVFRANYQGDIGPHVAKALYGIEKIMEEKQLSLSEVQAWSSTKKAHFLGEGYVRGNVDYDTAKDEIDGINSELYEKLEVSSSNKQSESRRNNVGSSRLRSNDIDMWTLYQITRQWSLDYYDDFYRRFYTTFDKLFFESEMVEPGKRIVEKNLGTVFEKDNGAIIFSGEQYGLHTRVFITRAGNPTYEGKEMGNGFAEYAAFPFDMKIHVVGSEQAGYFQVVFKALELIDPQKFENKQQHISMGMVSIVGMKMSSRTGEILRVDELIEKVKKQIEALVEEGRIQGEDKDAVVEMVAIGAIKYSVLKVGTGANVAFDIEKSVNLEGDSGPYLQYTYARTQSVLAKFQISNDKFQMSNWKFDPSSWRTKLEIEELDLLRFLYRFDGVVQEAGTKYSPNILCEYLFDLAKLYNLFYQKHKIIGSKEEESRLALTKATGDVLRSGLDLLGIKAPERM